MEGHTARDQKKIILCLFRKTNPYLTDGYLSFKDEDDIILNRGLLEKEREKMAFSTIHFTTILVTADNRAINRRPFTFFQTCDLRMRVAPRERRFDYAKG